jgi:hypothetical protein
MGTRPPAGARLTELCVSWWSQQCRPGVYCAYMKAKFVSSATNTRVSVHTTHVGFDKRSCLKRCRNAPLESKIHTADDSSSTTYSRQIWACTGHQRRVSVQLEVYEIG